MNDYRTLHERIKYLYKIGYLDYDEYIKQMNKYDERMYDLDYYDVYNLVRMMNKDGEEI